MAVYYTCRNPNCRTQMKSPDSAAGRKVRCSACGTVQRIPAGEGLSINLDAPTEDPAGLDVERPGGPAKRFRSGGAIECGECGKAFAAISQRCPACGWVNAELLKRTPPPEEQTPPRITAWDYLKSIMFGLTNIRSLLILVLLTFIQLMFFGMFLAHLVGAKTGLLGLAPSFFARLAFLGGFLQILFAGYFLSFHLEVIQSAHLCTGRAPNLPRSGLLKIFELSLWTIILLDVYVLPIVTLPLLPLALFAMANCDDERALDVRWALRAAIKYWRQLAGLWAILVIWLAALIMLVWGFWRVALLAKWGPVVGWMMTILLPIVAHMLVCAMSCCIGLFALDKPELEESLPEKGNLRIAVIYIAAGMAAAYLVWGFVVPALLGGGS